MSDQLSEIPALSPDTTTYVREHFSKIPGVQFLGLQMPQHPWVMNRRGATVVSEINVHPASPEVLAWLKSVLVGENIEGIYLFGVDLPLNMGGGTWARVRFDRTYDWIEPLWSLSRGHMRFVSLDETYSLLVSALEWEHTAQVKRRAHMRASLPVSFSLTPDIIKIERLSSLHALAGDSSGDAFLWRIPDWRMVRFLQGYGELVNGIAVDEALAVSAAPHGMFLWDISTGEIVRSFKRYKELSTAIGKVIQIDSKHVLTTLIEKPGGFVLWDISTGEAVRVYGTGEFAEDVISIDEKHFVASLHNATLQFWDLMKGEPVRSYEGHQKPSKTVARIDEETIASGSLDGTVRLWNLSTGESRQLTGIEQPIISLAKVEDGILTITGNALVFPQEYKLTLWHPTTGLALANINVVAPQNIPYNLEMLDHKTVIVQFYDGVLLVAVGREGGKVTLSLMGQLSSVYLSD